MAGSGQGLSAVVLGATGLVGSELLRQLAADARFASVATLGRRASALEHPKVRDHVVDLEAAATWGGLVRGDVLFSALGTTLRAAGSRAAQYRVDHGYQFRVAREAQRHGVGTCVLVSSAGASPRSALFYSRMKGELERDVETLGFERTRILRPGPLEGPRREHRAGERWALRVLRPLAPVLPASLRPIHAEIVARAAIASCFEAAPGVVRYEAADLFRLGSAAPR